MKSKSPGAEIKRILKPKLSASLSVGLGAGKEGKKGRWPFASIKCGFGIQHPCMTRTQGLGLSSGAPLELRHCTKLESIKGNKNQGGKLYLLAQVNQGNSSSLFLWWN